MENKPPIVFLHGMWCTPAVWHRLSHYFAERGYEVHMPALRHHEAGSQDLAALGQTSIRDYLDDLDTFLNGFEQRPVLIGHSMGGLLALLLASRGCASQTILLSPAAPAGLVALRMSVIRTFAAVLSRWGFWKTAMKLSPKAANYGLFNRLPDEARPSHYQDMVFESGRAASEIAFWYLDRQSATKPNGQPDCPMLVMAGKHDRITPASVCQEVADKYQADFLLLDDHAHWLISEPGWEKVAEQCEIWLEMNQ
ncbi:alpha/beta hydrolase [Parendozoicomonas haliclonae]|uniref:Alpha/beta hydrolase family protein n=1 Tax=Parendozoicomonas haliclonae TaxID=1960125 RepID=A0A1X7AM50_9GAMM|nr:alpha/beta hydrolase [Parendozoicomonas haliclonae]SMA48886.1 Alpha/beta hydrolase family protein [Parendozoicomonas haliclonae]